MFELFQYKSNRNCLQCFYLTSVVPLRRRPAARPRVLIMTCIFFLFSVKEITTFGSQRRVGEEESAMMCVWMTVCVCCALCLRAFMYLCVLYVPVCARPSLLPVTRRDTNNISYKQQVEFSLRSWRVDYIFYTTVSLPLVDGHNIRSVNSIPSINLT